MLAFESDGRANGVKMVDEVEAELGDARLDDLIGAANHEKLAEDIELLDGAAEEFDLDAVQHGELSPCSSVPPLTNFGVEPFLKEFLRLTPHPLPRKDAQGGELVEPCSDQFSGFIFKIQANMNKNHRDRIAFLRICSGKFERGMEAFHVQEGKNIKLATGTSLMADDRAIVSEAYAGDIIGLFDPASSPSATHSAPAKARAVCGHPDVRPRALRPRDPGRYDEAQAVRQGHGADRPGGRDPDLPRPRRRYGGGHRRRRRRFAAGGFGVPPEKRVQCRHPYAALPYEHLRWVLNDPEELDIKHLDVTSDTRAIEDMKGNPLLLFGSPWSINWAEQHNEALKLSEFGNLTF